MAKKKTDNFLDYIPRHVEKYKWETDEEAESLYPRLVQYIKTLKDYGFIDM